MTCPRCEKTTLTEMDRDGVTIDRCDRCRGIWLDRGELEKLMARGRDSEREDDDDRRRQRGGDDDDDDDDRGGRRGGKRSWWEIFD